MRGQRREDALAFEKLFLGVAVLILVEGELVLRRKDLDVARDLFLARRREIPQ